MRGCHLGDMHSQLSRKSLRCNVTSWLLKIACRLDNCNHMHPAVNNMFSSSFEDLCFALTVKFNRGNCSLLAVRWFILFLTPQGLSNDTFFLYLATNGLVGQRGKSEIVINWLNIAGLCCCCCFVDSSPLREMLWCSYSNTVNLVWIFCGYRGNEKAVLVSLWWESMEQ